MTCEWVVKGDGEIDGIDIDDSRIGGEERIRMHSRGGRDCGLPL